MKTFRVNVQKKFQVYRTVSSSNFFYTSKNKNCLETANKHILLKSCKKLCCCICLKVYFPSKCYSKRLWKQPWQHQWKTFCWKSRKTFTYLRFFPDRLLRDRFFLQSFLKKSREYQLNTFGKNSVENMIFRNCPKNIFLFKI